MTTNPILDEIHEARAKILADYNGDVHAYVVDARKRALASGRRIVEPKQRTKHYIEVADQPLPDGGASAATR